MLDNKELFHSFYDLKFRWVANFLSARLTNAHDVEDIAAEVFSVIWQQWSTIDQTSNLDAYLFTIVRNKLNDHLRRKYKFADLNIQIETEDIVSDEADYTSNTHVYKEKLMSLVGKLDADDQEFFRYKYQENLSSNLIAERLGITKNNVKVRNNRLVKKLKKLWEKNQI